MILFHTFAVSTWETSWFQRGQSPSLDVWANIIGVVLLWDNTSPSEMWCQSVAVRDPTSGLSFSFLSRVSRHFIDSIVFSVVFRLTYLQSQTITIVLWDEILCATIIWAKAFTMMYEFLHLNRSMWNTNELFKSEWTLNTLCKLVLDSLKSSDCREAY